MSTKLKLAIAAALITGAAVAGIYLRPDPQAKAERIEEQRQEIAASLKAVQIDLYFAGKGMPLAGKGAKFVEAAETSGLDWRLLPAIAVRESSGGKEACGANVFGWASCKTTFETIDEAIDYVALNLGGNNPRTAAFYGGKTTAEKLNAYNPPAIVPDYTASVLKIMAAIGDE